MKGMLWAVAPKEAVLAVAPARFEEVYADHVTLRFKVGEAPYQPWIGRRFQAAVTAEAWNDDIQAIRVELPADVRPLCENEHPHVTVSARRGVSPKKSNALLEAPAHEAPLAAELSFEIVWKPFG